MRTIGRNPTSAERARTNRLLDLIDAVKLTLAGEDVDLDTVQTRIRKLSSDRQAERVIKDMIETAKSLGFDAGRVQPGQHELGVRRPESMQLRGGERDVEMLDMHEEVTVGPSSQDLDSGRGGRPEPGETVAGRWTIKFSRPRELLAAASAELNRLGGLSQASDRRRETARDLKQLYRKHGLCTSCKEPAFKAGLCKRHYEDHARRTAEYRRDHKERGLCSNCSEPVFAAGLCEDHYLTTKTRITAAQRKRREAGLCVVLGCEGDVFKGGLCQRHYEDSDARKKEFRSSHKEKGLCSECNEPAFSGGLCVVHNEKHRKSQSRRRKELVALGRCRECREPSGGRSYCQKHEAEHAARQKQRYDVNRAAGLCGLCGGVPPEGKALCEACRADQAASEQRVVAKRDQSGLCRKCGKSQRVEGKTRCQACIEDQKERGRRHYEKLKASPLCIVCQERPKVEGKTYCAECLEEARLKQAARRKKPNPGDGSITFWHGTQRKKLAKVLESGLEPSEGWGGAGTFGVYLAGSPESALYWAKTAFMLAKGEKLDVGRFDFKYGDRVDELLAIVSVTIPPEAITNLRADMEQAEDVGFEGDPDDWEASLDEIGDVMYDGKIPAKWVREVELPS